MLKNAMLIDICGTLFRSNTTFDFLDYFCGNVPSYCRVRRLTKNVVWRCLNSLIYRTLHVDLTRKLYLKVLNGKSRDELLLMADEFYEKFLVQRKNQAVWSLIENAENPILLSATVDFVAETIARKMGIAHFSSSQLQYENGICCGCLKTDLLRNKQAWLTENQIVAPYKAIVTDNPGDATLFKNCEQIFVVAPSTSHRWQCICKPYKNVTFLC